MPDRLVIDAIPIEVRRSKRRKTRIGLAFDPAGFVIMEAPPGTDERDVRLVVARHGDWLRNRLQAVQSEAAPSASLRYVSGERMYLSGRSYTLSVRDGDRDGVALVAHDGRPDDVPDNMADNMVDDVVEQVQLPLFARDDEDGTLVVTLGPARPGAGPHRGLQPGPQHVAQRARIARLLKTWYLTQAAAVFAEELAQCCDRLPWLNGRVPPWRQRFMRSQWGSCSQTGRIALNTHLVKLPRALVRYVVLHELCHLVEHNHGPRFYALMTRYMPDWQLRRGELDRFLPVLIQD
ncbi:MAG: M48 family metallopeptidase [Gammaproteobacteria bacterium]